MTGDIPREAAERTATGAGHVPFLDGVRGVAILLVILIHASFGAYPTTLAGKAWLFAARGGWCGVDLFFVLSGFLITGILWDTKHASNYLGSFYARRFLRIVPLYYLFLGGLTAGLWLARPAYAGTFAHLGWHWAYLSNVALVGPVGWDPLIAHFWSLSIEEQFYLVWPWVILACSLRGAMTACVIGILVAIGSRIAFHQAAWSPDWSYAMPFARMDALLAGAFVALALRASPDPTRLAPRFLVTAVSCGVLALVAVIWQRSSGWSGTPMLIGGLTAIAVCFAAGIGALACGALPRLAATLSLAPLRSIGRYSYCMYIVHWPLLVLAQHLGIGPGLAGQNLASYILYSALLALAAWLCGWVSWRLWERPFLRLKERFEARMATS